MKKILIFTAGFGEGHNTAARNIRDALEHIAPDEAKVEVLDLFDTCYGKLNDWVRKAYITAINRTPRVWGKIYNVIDGTQFVEANMVILAKMKRAMSDVLADLENFMHRLVLRDPKLYLHNAEGPDDMPSHIRAVAPNATKAANGSRTRDLELGKLALYQLSYRRTRFASTGRSYATAVYPWGP